MMIATVSDITERPGRKSNGFREHYGGRSSLSDSQFDAMKKSTRHTNSRALCTDKGAAHLRRLFVDISDIQIGKICS